MRIDKGYQRKLKCVSMGCSAPRQKWPVFGLDAHKPKSLPEVACLSSRRLHAPHPQPAPSAPPAGTTTTDCVRTGSCAHLFGLGVIYPRRRRFLRPRRRAPVLFRSSDRPARAVKRGRWRALSKKFGSRAARYVSGVRARSTRTTIYVRAPSFLARPMFWLQTSSLPTVPAPSSHPLAV